MSGRVGWVRDGEPRVNQEKVEEDGEVEERGNKREKRKKKRKIE